MEVVMYMNRDGYIRCETTSRDNFTPAASWQWWKLYEAEAHHEDVSVHPGRNDWSRSSRQLKVNWESAVLIAKS